MEWRTWTKLKFSSNRNENQITLFLLKFLVNEKESNLFTCMQMQLENYRNE